MQTTALSNRSTWASPATYKAARRMLIPCKPTKSAGGDPRRPRRLRRCVNQDRSRGRSYTSNRGCHATFNGSVRLDTSGTRPFVETVLVLTPDAAMRTSPSHVYYFGRFSVDGYYNRRRGGFPSMATSIAGGASTARKCYPRCPDHQVFQDRPLPCPKHVGATATIFVAAQPPEPLP